MIPPRSKTVGRIHRSCRQQWRWRPTKPYHDLVPIGHAQRPPAASTSWTARTSCSARTSAHPKPRHATVGRSAPRVASCARSLRCCASPVSRTWRARSITSSNPSATICSPATRPVKACPTISWPSFRSPSAATHALGIVVWPMVEFEADDAIAAAADRWRDAPELEQIVLCTPGQGHGPMRPRNSNRLPGPASPPHAR